MIVEENKWNRKRIQHTTRYNIEVYQSIKGMSHRNNVSFNYKIRTSATTAIFDHDVVPEAT